VSRNDPALAGQVCLALVCEGPTHGWAVAGLLAPDAEIGRIWSLTRALTYRAIDQLVADHLVERSGIEPGGGRNRTVVIATAQGRRVSRRWLDEPVSSPRAVRSELLLKLALRARIGLSSAALVAAQRERFAPILAATDAEPTDDFVARWRREHLLAIDRVLSSRAGAEE
jgi:DNA-binding PadR family transcriptional regulator